MNKSQEPIPICSYEGSDYQARFWENQHREYEDLSERIAIRHLLPPKGKRLLEIGTGFGRLVDLYQGYEQIVLLDYSKSLLRQAQQRLGRNEKYTYIAADLYQIPLPDCLADTICMVRVMHHVADVPAALRQIHRVLRPGGTFVLEFASKLHAKSVLRYTFRRQNWSPFDPSPIEFVSLNYDFHPRWMRARLGEQGFEIQQTRTVSHFRIPFLKRIVPPRVLSVLDGALQWTGRWWTFTPSVFLRSFRAENGETSSAAPAPHIGFRCPACEASHWQSTPTEMHCLSCHARWVIDDGIYDFRTQL